MSVSTVLLVLVFVGISFAALYRVLVERFTTSFASPYPKADVQVRLLAGGVDAFLVSTCGYFSWSSGSWWFALLGSLYLISRDGMAGRSVGKALLGLKVVRLDADRPCSIGDSARRNLVFLIPAANVVAVFFEWKAILRDPQGHRLGDRIAGTQVVVGLGARDLVRLLARWSEDWAHGVRGSRRRPDRVPVGPTRVRGRVGALSGPADRLLAVSSRSPSRLWRA